MYDAIEKERTVLYASCYRVPMQYSTLYQTSTDHNNQPWHEWHWIVNTSFMGTAVGMKEESGSRLIRLKIDPVDSFSLVLYVYSERVHTDVWELFHVNKNE